MNKGQQALDLKIPKKVVKKQKGFYLAESMIKFIKDEATRLKCSENDVITAIIVQYQDSIGYKAEDSEL